MSKRFEGRPCPRDGNTTRYISNKNCVVCTTRWYKEWEARHPSAAKKHGCRPRERDGEKIAVMKRRYAGLPEPTRAPPKVCECCGGPPGKLRLALDHCHTTGKFRGWLCGKCNTAIGKLGDTVVGVQRAIKYLQENG